jgi:hypothetical protein
LSQRNHPQQIACPTHSSIHRGGRRLRAAPGQPYDAACTAARLLISLPLHPDTWLLDSADLCCCSPAEDFSNASQELPGVPQHQRAPLSGTDLALWLPALASFHISLWWWVRPLMTSGSANFDPSSASAPEPLALQFGDEAASQPAGETAWNPSIDVQTHSSAPFAIRPLRPTSDRLPIGRVAPDCRQVLPAGDAALICVPKPSGGRPNGPAPRRVRWCPASSRQEGVHAPQPSKRAQFHPPTLLTDDPNLPLRRANRLLMGVTVVCGGGAVPEEMWGVRPLARMASEGHRAPR